MPLAFDQDQLTESVLPAVYGDEPLTDDQIPVLADALARILHWCWHNKSERLLAIPQAMHRFTAMCAVIRPDLLNDMSYQQIAAKLGVTKACLSKNAIQFQDNFQLHFRRSRRHETRAIFAKAQFEIGKLSK